ncbi:putative quinol monooxygenase [Micromonospora sp. DT53]|uniref:putative quinol monooxygenase n=1 Tax=Micromonospora sp. DT53 TaxID=3393444 RepID=UPI003CF2A6AF
MSTEVAFFTVKAGTEEDFLKVFRDKVVDLFRRGGAEKIRVYRSLVSPNQFVKTGEWRSREARLTDFVGSPLYQEFLALMGPFLDAPPSLDDYDTVYRD